MTRFLPQGRQHGFDEPEDILHSHERRLDVDLRELRLAVVAQVLVAKAARDLEIAIEPRHHEELLVDLRRLRQREELSRVHARRHQVVARAFRSRFREDRRLDLEEFELGQRAPGALQQPVTQHEIRLHLRPAEVQVTVLEPQLLGGKLLAFGAGHGDGGRDGRTDDHELRRVDLDLAGRELGVPHVRRARDDFAFHFDDRLARQGARDAADVFRRAGADGDLYETGAVAQIDEHDPAQVAAPVHPPAQPHALPRVLRPQLAAAQRAPRRPTHVAYAPSASHTAR